MPLLDIPQLARRLIANGFRLGLRALQIVVGALERGVCPLQILLRPFALLVSL
jgi:hypothetical protein